MEAKDLMLGDWVKIKTYGVSDKFERTEAHIYVKVAEVSNGLITADYNNDIKEPYRICENTEIEPIQLTPEILEKNSWEKRPTGYVFYIDGKRYDDSLWYIFGSNTFVVNTAEFQIKYVHELQHALRLCGIDKEIEL